jgi:hypothetical protein
MTKYGLLGTGAMLAVSTPAFAQMQTIPPTPTIPVEGVPLKSTTAVPAQTVTLPGGQTLLVVPVAPAGAKPEAPPPPPTAAAEGWVPAQWNWDDADQRYVWVSGHYAAPPAPSEDAAATWVPGHYVPGEDGYIWVAAHWE